MAVTLRPIAPKDEAFLFEVYAGARLAELDQVPWDDAQKRAFLSFQFNAQHQHYQRQFADADYSVILDEGTPVGRFYVHRRADEIRILDLALLPEHRRRGIGSALLKDLLATAEAAGKPVRLYVESYQQGALRLLEHLGFAPTRDHGISVLMEWRPGASG